MINLINSKRANVSITVLVLIVFAICSLTLLSFYLADRNAANEFRKVRLVSVSAFFADQIQFYEEIGVDSSKMFSETVPSEDQGLTNPFNSYNFSIEDRNGKNVLTARYFENSGFLWLKKKEVLYVEYPLD